MTCKRLVCIDERGLHDGGGGCFRAGALTIRNVIGESDVEFKQVEKEQGLRRDLAVRTLGGSPFSILLAALQ